MPRSAERNALLFVAAAILLGTAVRLARSTADASSAPADRAQLERQIALVEAARGQSRLASPGAAPQSRQAVKAVDVNSATLAQLQSLPRVGPVLAQRIKAWRDSAGAFNSLDDLDKVKGIGPAMLKELAPRVTFSKNRRP
jgi:competence ComEA-like helix-hairpin-helix protein